MIIPTGFAQSNLIFSGNMLPTGAQITCGHGLGAFGGTPLLAAIDVRDAFENEILPSLANAITLDLCRVKFGPNATGPEGEATSGQVGGSPDDSNSPNAAMLVRKVTGSGGRANKGRFFCPGLTEAMIDTGGVLDPDVFSALTTAWNAYYDALVLADLPPRVLHSAGSPVSTPTTVTGFQLQVLTATQRRRLRR